MNEPGGDVKSGVSNLLATKAFVNGKIPSIVHYNTLLHWCCCEGPHNDVTKASEGHGTISTLVSVLLTENCDEEACSDCICTRLGLF